MILTTVLKGNLNLLIFGVLKPESPGELIFRQAHGSRHIKPEWVIMDNYSMVYLLLKNILSPKFGTRRRELSSILMQQSKG